MGFSYAHNIQRAGQHVLALLQETGTIRYSEQFYDGSEETAERLCKALDVDESYCPEGLVDLAVGQLEQMGHVSTRELDTKMADGENDYEISITSTGVKVIESGEELEFYDAE